jgi:hypothetical protein
MQVVDRLAAPLADVAHQPVTALGDALPTCDLRRDRDNDDRASSAGAYTNSKSGAYTNTHWHTLTYAYRDGYSDSDSDSDGYRDGHSHGDRTFNSNSCHTDAYLNPKSDSDPL